MNSPKQFASAWRALARFVADLDLAGAPDDAHDALERVLVDSIGVAVAGAETPELRRLLSTWPLPQGEATILGTALRTDAETAALLGGAALCCLELDEGNKFARGHPGAHVLPAVLAEAERTGAPGRAVLTAVLGGYEVATRIARAFSPAPGLHPHGHWGAIGAAAGIARLHGWDAERTAAAMDAASGLALATPFSAALDGSFVRNLWVGSAAANGIRAARLVEAGLAQVAGTAASTLGGLLGQLDVAATTEELGRRFEITGGYVKRHSSCAYTHPCADAALELVDQHGLFDAAEIDAIEVATHALAQPLRAAGVATRLAAMFSIPHVVAGALTQGDCAPERHSDEAIGEPSLAALRHRVSLVEDQGFTARLPWERPARVTVALHDGRTFAAEVANAIGDSAHHPYTLRDIVGKIVDLDGDTVAEAAVAAVSALRRDETVAAALQPLRTAIARKDDA